MTKIKIHNRRYLGNKFKLLPFIKQVIEKECTDINIFADLFSGTGSVSSAFLDRQIITNDLLYCNYLSNLAWFGSEKVNKKKVCQLISQYNSIDYFDENYMTINFSDTFFSRDNCSLIGIIREDIENKFNENELNLREKAVLVTSLLYAMDKVANTVGHYDAFIQNNVVEKRLQMYELEIENNLNENNVCFNSDANYLAKVIYADIVYLDPPYNSRQYSDAYHLLENVALWNKPEVYGVARKMDRSEMKSKYSTREATKAFADLINNINARYILLSYNNMSNKGNDRSNAKISDEDILRILKTRGQVKIFEQSYKSYTTGKSEKGDNIERLFLCTVNDDKKLLLASPFNYTGGKFKIISQILEKLPSDPDIFIDLFCGGCNVGINVNSEKVIFNDYNDKLIGLLNFFKNEPLQLILNKIWEIIEIYNLSNTQKNGYEYYECNSSDGLGKYNKPFFNILKVDFNNRKSVDFNYFIMFYVLIVYSFNNQIRFNSKGEFNLPVGKRDFNKKMEYKLISFIERIKLIDCVFECSDFLNLDISLLTKKSIVYADPPYLITCATYNEQGGWDHDHEYMLLEYLDNLNRKGIRFALSNVLESKGQTNMILVDWLSNRNYFVHRIKSNYSNSSYQLLDKISNSNEVLITNF